jgi:hypothetical protein
MEKFLIILGMDENQVWVSSFKLLPLSAIEEARNIVARFDSDNPGTVYFIAEIEIDASQLKIVE